MRRQAVQTAVFPGFRRHLRGGFHTVTAFTLLLLAVQGPSIFAQETNDEAAVSMAKETAASVFSKRVQTALEKRISVNFDAETLDDIAQWLTEETGLPFENDLVGFRGEGINVRDSGVTIQARDITFRAFLKLLSLRTECHVDWTVERECVCLAPRSAADKKRVHATFDVNRLLTVWQDHHDAIKDRWYPQQQMSGLGGGYSGSGGGMFAIPAEDGVSTTISQMQSTVVLAQLGGSGGMSGGGGGGAPSGGMGGAMGAMAGGGGGMGMGMGGATPGGGGMGIGAPPGGPAFGGMGGMIVPSGPGYARTPQSLLKDLLMGHVPAPWQDVDGQGGTMNILGNVLSVQASQRQVEEIRLLLRTLNQALQANPKGNPLYVVSNQPGTERIMELLATSKSLEFIDMPLDRVLTLLADQYGFNLAVDSQALTDEGFELDEFETTLSNRTVSLRSILDSILTPHQLAWDLCEGSLIVTTAARAGGEPTHTVVFGIQDLLKHGIREYELMQTLQLGDTTWQDVDGVGGRLTTACGSLLVVRHTAPVLERVSDMLTQLRKAYKGGTNPDRTPARRQLATKFYDVPDGADAGVFVETIAKLIEPDTWNSSTQRFAVTKQRIAIRHAVFAHEKIAKFITEANAGRSAGSEIGGAMGGAAQP